MKKNVLIIAEHVILGELLTSFLQEHFKDFTIFSSSSMNDARVFLNSVLFDIVLTDLHGVDESVISIIKEISLISPRTRCLLLGAAADASLIDIALSAGASGFLTKICSREEILKSIKALVQGRTHFSPDVIQSLCEFVANGKPGLPHSALSPREFEIFILIARGLSLKSISSNLNLSASTVAVHKHNISKKTGIKSMVKIAHYCLEHGLL